MKILALLILLLPFSGCLMLPHKLNDSEKQMIKTVYVPQSLLSKTRLEVGFPGDYYNTPKGQSTYNYQLHEQLHIAAHNQIRKSLLRYLRAHLQESNLFAVVTDIRDREKAQAEFVFRIRRTSILSGEIFSEKRTPTLQMDAWLVMNPPFQIDHRRLLITESIRIREPKKHPVVWHKFIWVKGPAKYTTEVYLQDVGKLKQEFDEVARIGAERLMKDLKKWMRSDNGRPDVCIQD